jgi:hypothetical protein
LLVRVEELTGTAVGVVQLVNSAVTSRPAATDVNFRMRVIGGGILGRNVIYTNTS